MDKTDKLRLLRPSKTSVTGRGRIALHTCLNIYFINLGIRANLHAS
jgi:hypothetical protein